MCRYSWRAGRHVGWLAGQALRVHRLHVSGHGQERLHSIATMMHHRIGMWSGSSGVVKVLQELG